MEGIRHAEVRVAAAREGSEPCWHLFPVCVAGEGQRAFLEHMKASGVTASIHYPAAIPDQPALAHVPFERADDGLIARRFCASEVSLPIHPYFV